ncbi:dispanin subfamily A member 2b-like [Hoplias malabaricus]|uniref:dispanin subfamily A member 2b-like n=1 Tax=Hoplias malabaricus TaxID=27720 RepID=UPI003461CC0E
MQSSFRPQENYPLQGGMGPGQGAVVVTMIEHPKDYIVWSMFSISLGNPFCLGLLAFYYSVKSRDRKMLGDLEGARSYGSTARSLNGWALALSIITLIMFIITVVISVTILISSLEKHRINY